MPPVELVDFTSYDLGRLLAALELELGRHPDAYGATALWTAVQDVMPWDQRARRCWDDQGFAARYQWLRARCIPAGSPSSYPLRDVYAELSRVLVDRMELDPTDDEPF